MKTIKRYAIMVIDNSCNDEIHSIGIYGKGDYTWIDQRLNGGTGEYDMTEAEAIRQKADFEREMKERDMEWASAEIDSIEIPIATTLQDIADYYNESDIIDVNELERMIEANSWDSDTQTTWGICHNDQGSVKIDDDGKAVVELN